MANIQLALSLIRSSNYKKRLAFLVKMEVLFTKKETNFVSYHPYKQGVVFNDFKIAVVLAFDQHHQPIGFNSSDSESGRILITSDISKICLKINQSFLDWNYVYSSGKIFLFLSLNLPNKTCFSMGNFMAARAEVGFSKYEIPLDLVSPGYHRFKAAEYSGKIQGIAHNNPKCPFDLVQVKPSLVLDTYEAIPDGPLFFLDESSRIIQAYIENNNIKTDDHLISNLIVKTRTDKKDDKTAFEVFFKYKDTIPSYPVIFFHDQLQNNNLVFEGQPVPAIGPGEKRSITLQKKREFVITGSY